LGGAEATKLIQGDSKDKGIRRTGRFWFAGVAGCKRIKWADKGKKKKNVEIEAPILNGGSGRKGGREKAQRGLTKNT